MQPHHVHELADGTGGTTTSLLMPAWTTGPCGGRCSDKVISVAPANRARGLPGLHGTYLLHGAATSVRLALLDGDELTVHRAARRTSAAASAIGSVTPQLREADDDAVRGARRFTSTPTKRGAGAAT